MTTVTTTEPYSGLSLASLLKHTYFEAGQVAGAEVVYDKFPRWFVIDKLNDRHNKFVFHAQCLRRVAIVRMQANGRNYKLPGNCMEGGILSYPKFYTSTTDYQNLEVKDLQWLDDHFEGWLTQPANDIPLYVYMGESYGNLPMLGVYPPPTTDGDDYTLTPDTGVVVGSTLPGTSTNITGLATGGSGSSLVDSTVDFTTFGLVPGITVLNVTDGSKGVIQTIAATTLTLSTLTGGSTNTFVAGNSYNILAGEYGVITSWSNSEKVIFSSDVGGVSNITIPKGNIRIEYIPYPLPFPPTGNDNQFPEIPPLYHMDLAMGVVGDLLRTFTEGSKEFQRAVYYEGIYSAAVVLARGKKGTRPFENKPVSFRPIPKGSWRRNG